MNRTFVFGSYSCAAVVSRTLPDTVALGIPDSNGGVILVCDHNTEKIAQSIVGVAEVPVLVLEAGEEAKTWQSVDRIIGAALKSGLGRDGLFVGVGGGVVTDLVSFAASVYMRGARLTLVPTTLLAMVDASLGGKTGFDLYGLKNLVGTFRPAELVSMSTDTLVSLPAREWLSGFSEVIKTAIIGDGELFTQLESNIDAYSSGPSNVVTRSDLPELVSRCVAVKGQIVESDPTETGSARALLNLGHTFGHALETSAGLGVLTHGEAVAWGIARACALGVVLGITPESRAERIVSLLEGYNYCTDSIHPASPDANRIIAAMGNDKKKKGGSLRFIVPGSSGALITKVDDPGILLKILGESE